MWITAQLPLQLHGEMKGFSTDYSSIRQILHLLGYSFLTASVIETSCFYAGFNRWCSKLAQFWFSWSS